jgi:hypothetical protein
MLFGLVLGILLLVFSTWYIGFIQKVYEESKRSDTYAIKKFVRRFTLTATLITVGLLLIIICGNILYVNLIFSSWG